MKIGIIECGTPPDAARRQFGSYGDMVATMLGGALALDGAPARYIAFQGSLPPRPEACDAYVLTGGAAGVHDGLPWMADLLGFLRQARGRAALVGICLGHQAMAQAFGGTVDRSAQGWGVGLQRYAVVGRAPFLCDAAEVAVPAFHQDQVVAVPPGARVLAHSAFTPFAALDYGDALSVQFHPEITPAFAVALLGAQRALYGPLAAPAIDSYAATRAAADGRARVAGWIARFLLAMSGGGKPLAPAANPGSF